MDHVQLQPDARMGCHGRANRKRRNLRALPEPLLRRMFSSHCKTRPLVHRATIRRRPRHCRKLVWQRTRSSVIRSKRSLIRVYATAFVCKSKLPTTDRVVTVIWPEFSEIIGHGFARPPYLAIGKITLLKCCSEANWSDAWCLGLPKRGQRAERSLGFAYGWDVTGECKYLWRGSITVGDPDFMKSVQRGLSIVEILESTKGRICRQS
jgi:hypothetical protein